MGGKCEERSEDRAREHETSAVRAERLDEQDWSATAPSVASRLTANAVSGTA